MSKPAFAICKQQRRRSACASAQSDETCFCHMQTTKAQISLCIRTVWWVPLLCCLDSILPLVSISKISSLYLASLAARAGLCLTWSQTLKTGFFVTRLNWAEAWQNKQNNLCLQWRLRSSWASAQSDQTVFNVHLSKMFGSLDTHRLNWIFPRCTSHLCYRSIFFLVETVLFA